MVAVPTCDDVRHAAAATRSEQPHARGRSAASRRLDVAADQRHGAQPRRRVRARRRPAAGAVGTSRLPTSLSGRLRLAAGLVLAAIVVTVGAAQAQRLGAHRGQGAAEADRPGPVGDQERGQRCRRTWTRCATRCRPSSSAALQNARRRRAARCSNCWPAGHRCTGPGVKLVVDDAKETSQGDTGGPRESSGFADTGRVRDRDMQRVVNGLWASGAEAITRQRAAADGTVGDPGRR